VVISGSTKVVWWNGIILRQGGRAYGTRWRSPRATPLGAWAGLAVLGLNRGCRTVQVAVLQLAPEPATSLPNPGNRGYPGNPSWHPWLAAPKRGSAANHDAHNPGGTITLGHPHLTISANHDPPPSSRRSNKVLINTQGLSLPVLLYSGSTVYSTVRLASLDLGFHKSG